jgi:hypothetical protein
MARPRSIEVRPIMENGVVVLAGSGVFRLRLGPSLARTAKSRRSLSAARKTSAPDVSMRWRVVRWGKAKAPDNQTARVLVPRWFRRIPTHEDAWVRVSWDVLSVAR